jgi:hypothetical protein
MQAGGPVERFLWTRDGPRPPLSLSLSLSLFCSPPASFALLCFALLCFAYAPVDVDVCSGLQLQTDMAERRERAERIYCTTAGRMFLAMGGRSLHLLLVPLSSPPPTSPSSSRTTDYCTTPSPSRRSDPDHDGYSYVWYPTLSDLDVGIPAALVSYALPTLHCYTNGGTAYGLGDGYDHVDGAAGRGLLPASPHGPMLSMQ